MEGFYGGHEIFKAYIDGPWNIFKILDGPQNVFLCSIFDFLSYGLIVPLKNENFKNNFLPVHAVAIRL